MVAGPQPQTAERIYVRGHCLQSVPDLPDWNRTGSKFRTTSRLAAVANVRIKPDDRLLEIRWDFVPRLKSGESLGDPAGFNVYRKGEGGDFGFLPVNPEPVPQSPYRDLRVENGKRYEYVIRALRNFRGTPDRGARLSGREAGCRKKQSPLPIRPASSGLSAGTRIKKGWNSAGIGTRNRMWLDTISTGGKRKRTLPSR